MTFILQLKYVSKCYYTILLPKFYLMQSRSLYVKDIPGTSFYIKAPYLKSAFMIKNLLCKGTSSRSIALPEIHNLRELLIGMCTPGRKSNQLTEIIRIIGGLRGHLLNNLLSAPRIWASLSFWQNKKFLKTNRLKSLLMIVSSELQGGALSMNSKNRK